MHILELIMASHKKKKKLEALMINRKAICLSVSGTVWRNDYLKILYKLRYDHIVPKLQKWCSVLGIYFAISL